MTETPDNSLFDEDQPEQVAEYLRLTLGLLNRKKISANPINYDLFYTYVAGKNTLLNEKIDEFLKTEQGWDHETARRIAEDIRSAVSNMRLKNVNTQETICDMSVSLGVVQYRHGESEEDVTARCDKALYNAKYTGRNRVVAEG